MKNKWLITGVLSAGIMVSFAVTAAAGEWQQDEIGWRWQNEDGTYPVSCWQWIDGNQDRAAERYYFNKHGYLLTNTFTPDGYAVNAEGAWVVNGKVQMQFSGSNIVRKKELEAEEKDERENEQKIKREDEQKVGQKTEQKPEEEQKKEELDIDRTIGKNFVKQKFIDCIGRNRSQVEQILGVTGEEKTSEDYPSETFDFYVNYVLSTGEDVRIDYRDDIAVRIFGTYEEILNFEKDEYTLSEIDAILGTEHVTLTANAHFWHLQEEPEVSMQLYIGYVAINAYY